MIDCWLLTLHSALLAILLSWFYSVEEVEFPWANHWHMAALLAILLCHGFIQWRKWDSPEQTTDIWQPSWLFYCVMVLFSGGSGIPLSKPLTNGRKISNLSQLRLYITLQVENSVKITLKLKNGDDWLRFILSMFVYRQVIIKKGEHMKHLFKRLCRISIRDKQSSTINKTWVPIQYDHL